MGNLQVIQLSSADSDASPMGTDGTPEVNSDNVILDVLKGNAVTEETLSKIPHYKCGCAHSRAEDTDILVNLLHHRFYVWNAFMYPHIISKYMRLVDEYRVNITVMDKLSKLFGDVILTYIRGSVSNSNPDSGIQYMSVERQTKETIIKTASELAAAYSEVFGKKLDVSEKRADLERQLAKYDILDEFRRELRNKKCVTEEAERLFRKAAADEESEKIEEMLKIYRERPIEDYDKIVMCDRYIEQTQFEILASIE